MTEPRWGEPEPLPRAGSGFEPDARESRLSEAGQVYRRDHQQDDPYADLYEPGQAHITRPRHVRTSESSAGRGGQVPDRYPQFRGDGHARDARDRRPPDRWDGRIREPEPDLRDSRAWEPQPDATDGRSPERPPPELADGHARKRPAQRPGARRPGGLPGSLGICIVIGSAAIGAAATVLTAADPGRVLGLCLVAGTAIAVCAVRPRAVYLIIPVPAPAYLAAAAAAGLAEGQSGGLSRTALVLAAAQWTSSGFPAMCGATALVIVAAVTRWAWSRRRTASTGLRRTP